MLQVLSLLCFLCCCFFFSKVVFDFVVRVVIETIFASAIPLLQCVGTFACCVSALGQYVPYYRTWATEISIPVTMLTHSLEWTLVQHTTTDHKWSRTQAVHEPSLQVAGLQVYATTLSCSFWVCRKIVLHQASTRPQDASQLKE